MGTTCLDNRIVDAEASAMKAGKAAMSKLEMRIRELEMELGTVQTQTQDSYKSCQRAERRVKELQFQQEEDKKNNDRMGDLATRPVQGQDLQDSDRGGRGDCRTQPGQVQEGSTGA